MAFRKLFFFYGLIFYPPVAGWAAHARLPCVLIAAFSSLPQRAMIDLENLIHLIVITGLTFLPLCVIPDSIRLGTMWRAGALLGGPCEIDGMPQDWYDICEMKTCARDHRAGTRVSTRSLPTGQLWYSKGGITLAAMLSPCDPHPPRISSRRPVL
jgi:hypothetical protein